MSEQISEEIRKLIMAEATLDKGSKTAFVNFIRKAMSDMQSAERREVYVFLVNCFMEADRDVDGAINAQEFDEMIERAALAPRRYGLAPKSTEMFKSDKDRFETRKKMFDEMDKDDSQTISLDEWIQYCTSHIGGKIKKVHD